MREEKGSYEDILYMPRPVSARHPRMPLQDRAAQFAPFAALTGYEEAIRETARLTEAFAEPAEEQRERLDEQLRRLLERMGQAPYEGQEAVFTCFEPDGRKEGGAYTAVRGRVKGIDAAGRRILLSDGASLPMDRITDITLP